MHQKVVTSIISGAKRVEQLAEEIGTTEVSLSSENLDIPDAVTRLPEEYLG